MVSIWRLPIVQLLLLPPSMRLVTFAQGLLGAPSPKPTTMMVLAEFLRIYHRESLLGGILAASTEPPLSKSTPQLCAEHYLLHLTGISLQFAQEMRSLSQSLSCNLHRKCRTRTLERT